MATKKRTHVSLEANISRFSWAHGSDVGWFTPNGGLHVHGEGELQPNRQLWSDDKPLLAARIFIGFKVGNRVRWKLDDVVKIVKRVRANQVGNPSSTFLLQRGIYAHSPDAGGAREVVDEPGAQVIIINTPDLNTSARDFQEQMTELSEELATRLKQESVILEIQRGGLTVKTIGVGPVA